MFGFIPLCSWRQESGGSCHAASFQLADPGLLLTSKWSKSGRRENAIFLTDFLLFLAYRSERQGWESLNVVVDPSSRRFTAGRKKMTWGGSQIMRNLGWLNAGRSCRERGYWIHGFGAFWGRKLHFDGGGSTV